MRSVYPFFSSAVSAVMAALSFGNVFSGHFQDQIFLPGAPTVGRRRRRDANRSTTRRRTGVRYPHSSRRQQARYARQIAAGQLRMAGVEERI